MPDPENLIISGNILADSNAFEIVRIWIADEQPNFILRTEVWNDPAAWGILIADLAKHVAETYVQHDGGDFKAILDRIVAGINAELD